MQNGKSDFCDSRGTEMCSSSSFGCKYDVLVYNENAFPNWINWSEFRSRISALQRLLFRPELLWAIGFLSRGMINRKNCEIKKCRVLSQTRMLEEIRLTSIYSLVV